MTLLKLLSSIPIMFYVSIAAFAASLAAQIVMSKGKADEESETEGPIAKKKSRDTAMIGDLAMAGLIGFGIAMIYFSWVLIADWRSSSGIFYPESEIDQESMPYVIDNQFPPAPPAKNK